MPGGYTDTKDATLDIQQIAEAVSLASATIEWESN